MDLYKALLVVFLAAIGLIAPVLTASFKLEQGDAGAYMQFPRVKRDHGHGITGPVHTYVKTDKHANFKWGVRHHVGKHYAGN